MNRIMFLLGVMLLVAPIGYRVWDKNQQDELINTYMSQVEELENEDAEACLDAAKCYNSNLYQTGEIDLASYETCLNLFDNGMMGSIEIPKISVNLPIYHGTEEETLMNGIGHLKESSLPVGGANSHAILTGHCGLPNAELFTRLDEVEENDLFYLNVCEERLTYQVCEIKVVKPEAVEVLEIRQDRDLVSLITCTPYGINTHRLVVTGERVKETPQADGTEEVLTEIETEDAELLSMRDKIILSIPVLILMLAFVRKLRPFRRLKRRRAMKRKMTGVVAGLLLLCTMDVSAATGSIKVEVSEDQLEHITCVRVGNMDQGEFYLDETYQEAEVDLNALKNAKQLENAAEEIMGFVEEECADKVALNQFTFENLEEGVYLIYSNEKTMLPTLVFLPMWNASEQTMAYDIKINPKVVEEMQSPATGWESGAGIYFALFVTSYVVILWISKYKERTYC